MNVATKHIILSVFVVVVSLTGCNTNEYREIVPTVQKSPIDLRTISTTAITSTFSATTRQKMRFVTTESTNNEADLYFYATHDLAQSNTGITNVVISMHGLAASDGQVKSEYNAINDGIDNSDLANNTVVIAPHFFHEGTGLELTWENATWRVGGKAARPAGAQLSSAQIVDYLLERYLLENENFPALKEVIIAGHSAGGQFAQRYAGISKVESSYPTTNFSYITSNPSHYLYINSNRWSGSTIYQPTNCDTYDDYPYGLSNINGDERYAFISKIGLETIRSNYINRAVYYLLGEQDTSGATRDCESQSQEGESGESRYLRGQYMLQFMDDQYPSNEHEVISVANAGHSASAIYSSPAFIQLMNQITN